MRKFSVMLNLPGQCECCGLRIVSPDKHTPGSYRVELPEGGTPTCVAIGDAARITLGGGQLVVELRQRAASRGTWALERLYNTDAFDVVCRLDEKHQDGSDWHSFAFKLPAFKPWYSTWCAELKFVEAEPLSLYNHGSLRPAANAATLRVKLETLE